MAEHKLLGSGFHYQFGWLRRPELDDSFDGYFVYEEADGDIVISQDPRHKHRMLLNIWQDPESGEKYTATSHAPYFTGPDWRKARPPKGPKLLG